MLTGSDIPPAGCDPDAIKLFVGGIPKGYTEGQLLPFFGTIGNVVDLIVVRDPGTRKSKGSAFVWYETRAQAEAAIQYLHMNHVMPNPTGKKLRPLVVRMANLSSQQQQAQQQQQMAAAAAAAAAAGTSGLDALLAGMDLQRQPADQPLLRVASAGPQLYPGLEASHAKAAFADVPRFDQAAGTGIGPSGAHSASFNAHFGAMEPLLENMAFHSQQGFAIHPSSAGSNVQPPITGSMLYSSPQSLQEGTVNEETHNSGTSESLSADGLLRQMNSGSMERSRNGSLERWNSMERSSAGSMDRFNRALFTQGSIESSDGSWGPAGPPAGANVARAGSESSWRLAAAAAAARGSSARQYPGLSKEVQQIDANGNTSISVQISHQQLPVVAEHMHNIQLISGATLNINTNDPVHFRIAIGGSKQQVEMASNLLGIIFNYF